MPAAALVGGSIISGIAGGIGASSAASAQEQAAQQALAAQEKYGQKAADAQTAATQAIQGYQQPYYNAGTSNLQTLSGLLSTPGQGLLSTYGQFNAPTLQQAEQDPGYQFQLQQGTNAINKNAAATGTLLSGNTGVALQNYGQGLASTSYQNTYNRALNSYLTNYNTWNQGQQNQFSRLGTLAQMGQGSANALSSAEQSGAINLGDIYGRIGQGAAQQYNNMGAAQASGDVGMANAFGGVAQSLGSLPLLSNMMRPAVDLSSTPMDAGMPGVGIGNTLDPNGGMWQLPAALGGFS